jgi:hypothetical protein
MQVFSIARFTYGYGKVPEVYSSSCSRSEVEPETPLLGPCVRGGESNGSYGEPLQPDGTRYFDFQLMACRPRSSSRRSFSACIFSSRTITDRTELAYHGPPPFAFTPLSLRLPAIRAKERLPSVRQS